MTTMTTTPKTPTTPAKKTNLTQASAQWANRPADERFWDLPEMIEATRRHREQAVTSTVPYGSLRVEAKGEDLRVLGETGKPAHLTNYAFGQLSTRAGAPAGYLRKLPATLAAQNINHGLKARDPSEKAALLFQDNGSMILRAALSEKYSRIWNHKILEKLGDVLPNGWRAPPARPSGNDNSRIRPATEADCLKFAGFGGSGLMTINPGDPIAPAGLYASDRDMFVFLVDDSQRIDNGTDRGLCRGMFLWNSEVGDKAFGMMGFMFDAVCGNHIVWGAEAVTEFRIIHIGRNQSAKAWNKLRVDVKKYAMAEAGADEAKIAEARSYEIAGTKAEVIEAVLGFSRKKKLAGINEDRIGRAFDKAEEHRDWYGVPPTTVWGMVNGLTEVSQEEPHASTRVKLDRAAGRVMEIAF
jgi:hypothetical protein